MSQSRYRRHGLARLVKGIPAEIQSSWFRKVGLGIPVEIQTSWFDKVSKGYHSRDTDSMVLQDRLRVSQRRYRRHGLGRLVWVSQRRYRRHVLSRLVKGIPAEIQAQRFMKVDKGYPIGDTDGMV